MKGITGLFLVLLAAGCASMSDTECRTSDWQTLGWNDALSGNRPRIDLYAEQCSRFGVKPDEKQYMAGWGPGYNEWNRRVSRGWP